MVRDTFLRLQKERPQGTRVLHAPESFDNDLTSRTVFLNPEDGKWYGRLQGFMQNSEDGMVDMIGEPRYFVWELTEVDVNSLCTRGGFYKEQL